MEAQTKQTKSNSITKTESSSGQMEGDHDAAVAFLKCPKSTSCSFTREIWQYENIDLELFNNKMNEINWNEKIGFLNDVDDMVEEFTKLFLDTARQCIPTKTITVQDYDKPWFNNEIRKEIRLRNRLRIFFSNLGGKVIL